MRISLLAATVLSLGLAGAQTASVDKQNLGLVGDRFKPLVYDDMTPAQKTMIDHLLEGERRNLGGPFNVLLRSPEMGDLAQQFGASMRFHAGLPKPALETVIIVTARFWMAQFEWSAHKRAALQAGVSPAVVDAIANGQHPAGMTPDVETAYNFIVELLKTRQVSDPVFLAAKEQVRRERSGRYDRAQRLVQHGVDGVERRPLSGRAGGIETAGQPAPVRGTVRSST